jgi:hypothetical protein
MGPPPASCGSLHRTFRRGFARLTVCLPLHWNEVNIGTLRHFPGPMPGWPSRSPPRLTRRLQEGRRGLRGGASDACGTSLSGRSKHTSPSATLRAKRSLPRVRSVGSVFRRYRARCKNGRQRVRSNLRERVESVTKRPDGRASSVRGDERDLLAEAVCSPIWKPTRVRMRERSRAMGLSHDEGTDQNPTTPTGRLEGLFEPSPFIARSTRIHISFFHDDCHGMTPAAAIEHRSAGANRCAQIYAARRRAMKPSMPSPVNSSTRVAGSGTGPPAVTVCAAIFSSSAAIVGEIPSE